MSSKLWNRTLELLEQTDKTIPEICVGAHVNHSWLMSIKYGLGKRGHIRNPSVDKVERLYEFLSGKQLDI